MPRGTFKASLNLHEGLRDPAKMATTHYAGSGCLDTLVMVF